MTKRDEELLRDYAAKNICWQDLRVLGWHYSEVLDDLGALGLRPPILLEGGPNAAALARGRAFLREALAARKYDEDRDATPAKDWETVH